MNSSAGWSLAQTEHVPAESAYFDTLFSLSNGHVGVRPVLESESLHAVPGTFFIDLYGPGLAVRHEIANAPSWLPVLFRLYEPVPIHWDHVRILDFERRLDLRQAVLHTRARVSDAAGRITCLEWSLLVSAAERNAGLIRGRVTAENYAADVALESWIDARSGNAYLGGMTPEVQTSHFRIVREVELPGGGVLLEAAAIGASERLAMATRLMVAGEGGRTLLRRSRGLGELIAVRLESGQPREFVKVAAFLSSRETHQPVEKATELLRDLIAAGPARVTAAHAQVWEGRWRGADVEIEGDPRAQETIRFGLFHLMQAIDPGRDEYNIPARGLTSEYHSGHGFFNTEFFKLHYWILSDPARARALLMFRVRGLGAARRHAAETGYRGARYPEEVDHQGEPSSPWEIRDLFTGEVYHEWSGRETMFLSAAVACGCDWYWKATGDGEFMQRHGVEVLLETARFGFSLLSWREDEKVFSIRSVMGPDEYHYHVDDNLFTNFVVARNLRLAVAAFQWLEETAPQRAAALAGALGCTGQERADWLRAAESLRRPRVLDGGALEQFDGYGALPDRTLREVDEIGRPDLDRETAEGARTLQSFSTRLIKEADVILLHALFPEAFDDRQKELDLDFYEPRTTFESSLAASPYGVVAARLGRPGSAYKYFQLAGRYNLDYRPRAHYRNGIHLAAYAGAWQILVEGFLGLQWHAERLTVQPRSLPAHWRSIRLRIVWRGVPLRLRQTAEVLEVMAETGHIAMRIDRGPQEGSEDLEVCAGSPVMVPLPGSRCLAP